MTVGAAFQAGPLVTVRQGIASALDDLDDDVTVYPSWTSPSGPSVVLDGGGWKTTTGCGMAYTVRINCVFGNQAGTANDDVEELARQVFDLLRQSEYPVDPVPPVGILKFGDRDYPAVQITVTVDLRPEEE